MTESSIKVSGRVLLQVIDPDGSVAQEVETNNLVTTVGLQRIAQAMDRSLGSGTPSAGDAFTKIALGRTAGSPTTPAAGSDLSDVGLTSAEGIRTVDSGYPTLADADGDNSGSGTYVMTWHAEFPAGDYTATDIVGVAITEAAAAYPDSAETCFNHAAFSAVNKGASQALKVFVNISVAAS